MKNVGWAPQNEVLTLAKLLEDAKYATRHVKPEFKSYYMAVHLVSENVTLQKQGRWIEDLTPDGYEQKRSRSVKRCSACGWTNACRYNFCPNCGAQMNAENKPRAK